MRGLSLWTRFIQLLGCKEKETKQEDRDPALGYDFDDGNLVDLEYIPHDRNNPYRENLNGRVS